MNGNSFPSLDGPPRSNGTVSRSHLSQLLSTFRELREQGRSLMASMRASMFEIQAQRARLRGDHEKLTSNGARPPTVAPTVVAIRHLQVDYGMTPREVEVAILLAEGCSNSTVARRLGISPHTARHHTQRVLGKLGVHSRSEAGALLRR